MGKRGLILCPPLAPLPGHPASLPPHPTSLFLDVGFGYSPLQCCRISERGGAPVLLAGALGLGAHASDRLRAPMSWPPQPLAPKQAMARWSCCLGGHACSSQGRALGGGTGARPCGRGSKPSPARAWRLCGHPRRPWCVLLPWSLWKIFCDSSDIPHV